MPEELIRVVDVSEYTNQIPFGWWEKLRARHRVEGAIIQAWGGGYVPGRQNAHFHQQLAGAKRVFGPNVGAYVWPPSDIIAALAHIGPALDDLALVALDVESGAGVTHGQIDQVERRGLRAPIYTSHSQWMQIMGGSHQFKDEDLWMASYPLRDNSGETTQEPNGTYRAWWPTTIPDLPGFGGWTKENLVGRQHTGTCIIDFGPGEMESCDLNLFLRSAFRRQGQPAPQPGEEDDMFTDEDRKLVQDIRLDVEKRDIWMVDAAVLEEAAARIKGRGARLGALASQARTVIEKYQ